MANWKKGIVGIPLDAPRPKGRTISACLIVRNEEEKLGRCLASLLGAVDEIVVIDTGSTDRTVEIAKKYGAKVGHFTWIDDFAAARNAAIAMAKGDWILSIDADEWLANDQTRAFIRREVQMAGNVAFVPNIRLPSGLEYWGTTRLFPRLGSRWQYRIHEQVVLPRKDAKGIFDHDFLFLHDGYELEVKGDKAERNFAILRQQLAESAPGSDAYRHAQIYLARSRKNPLSAEDLAEMEAALKAAINFDEMSAQLLTYRMYRHWLEAGAFDEIDRVNRMAWEMGARGPFNHYAEAVRLYEEENKGAALLALSSAESANDLAYMRKALPSLFEDLRKMLREMPDPVPKPRAWHSKGGEERQTVSACIIVRDEEEKIGRCISSLLGAVDEIVVVDTGSTDATKEVAEHYGALVSDFAWVDDFSAARNAALDRATGDWVLSIDADEWLANQGTREFIRRVTQTDANVAFSPQTQLRNGFEYWSSPRLFRREGSRWEHIVHEHIRTSEGTEAIFNPAFALYSNGYEDPLMAAKGERNTRLLKLQLAQSEPGSPAYNHALVYLARGRKRPLAEEDVLALEEALMVAIPFDETSAQVFTYRLYRHWLERAEFETIDRVNDQAWEAGARGPFNYYARAVRFFEEGKKTEALEALSMAEKVNDIADVRGKLRPLFVDLRRMIGEMPG